MSSSKKDILVKLCYSRLSKPLSFSRTSNPFSTPHIEAMFSPMSLILLGLPLITSTPIVSRQLSTSDTENDLTNGSGCKAITVIFARGTTESGNVGSLAGPPFFDALSKVVNASNLAVQGVDYPADWTGFFAGGDATGSETYAQLVSQALAQCPNTKVVMSGYRYAFPLYFVRLSL